MITVQIKNGQGDVQAVINNIFNLQIDDEINKGGKLKIKFPTEEWLQREPIQKGDRISIDYGDKIKETIRLFDWYITDVTLRTTEAQIEADNWLSYLQFRILRTNKNYNNQTIQTVIGDVYSSLNNTFPLPVSLNKNDCLTKITKQFEKGTSFFDILKYCYQAEPKLIFRVLNSPFWNLLEVGENPWKILEGVREYDVNYQKVTNITDRSRKDSMDNFFSFIKTDTWEISNDTFNARTQLLFEQYDKQGNLALPSGTAVPSISVSRDIDWWNFDIWDRKEIRLVTWYERLPLSYLWLIQKRKITVDSTGWIKAEIKISENYKEDTNILDLLFQNLKQK